MRGLSCAALALDLLMVVAAAKLANAGYYELFVNVPRVHQARWPDPWAMPKSALTIMLAAAIIGIVAALLLLLVFRSSGRGRALARKVELAALLAMVSAWLAWTFHFMGNAGQFG